MPGRGQTTGSNLVVVGIASGLLAASFALPVEGPALLASGPGKPAAQALLDLLDEAPARVDYVVHGSEPRTSSMSWEAFAAWLETTSLGGALRGSGADGPVDGDACTVQLVHLYCGPDVGYGNGGGAFCDDSSAWVIYSGAPPGSAWQVVERGAPFFGACSCGFFITCYHYTEVELSPSKNPAVLLGLAWDGCYSAVWTVHANGYCPSSFPSNGLPASGALDTFLLHWRARGPGIAASFRLGELSFDSFIGIGAETCYDTPATPVDTAPTLPCPPATLS